VKVELFRLKEILRDLKISEKKVYEN